MNHDTGFTNSDISSSELVTFEVHEKLYKAPLRDSSANRRIDSQKFKNDKSMVPQLCHFNFVEYMFCFDIWSIDGVTECSAKLVQETVGSPFCSIGDLKMCGISAHDVFVTTGGPVHTFRKNNCISTTTLNKSETAKNITRAILTVPTCRLAMQIAQEFEKLSQGMALHRIGLIGGTNPGHQVGRHRKAVLHNTVETPGWHAQLSGTGDLSPHRVKTLVVDEVEQCLTDELAKHLRRILRKAPQAVQKILISAAGDVDAVRTSSGNIFQNLVLFNVFVVLQNPAQHPTLNWRSPGPPQNWFCA